MKVEQMIAFPSQKAYTCVREKTLINANGHAINMTRLLTVTTEAPIVTATDHYTDSDSNPQPSTIPDWYTLSPHEFIQTFFANAPLGFVEITYLANEGSGVWPRTVVSWAHIPLGDVPPGLPHITEMNEQGYNAYFGCAIRSQKHSPEQRISEKTGKSYTFYPRGKAHDAWAVTALWVDVDTPGEAGYHQLIENIVPPSIVVSSGGGWHGYWLLEHAHMMNSDDERNAVKRTLKGMALACGGDTKVADLARIMRIPGTINTKPGRGTRCEVYDFIPGYYRYEELELGYAPLAAPPQPQITRQIPVTASAGMPRWVDNYLTSGAVSGERNNTAYAAARALLDNGFGTGETERLITARALSDGLTDQEITTLLHSAENAPRSAPNMEPKIHTTIAADDHLMRQRKGKRS